MIIKFKIKCFDLSLLDRIEFARCKRIFCSLLNQTFAPASPRTKCPIKFEIKQIVSFSSAGFRTLLSAPLLGQNSTLKECPSALSPNVVTSRIIRSIIDRV